MNFFGRYYNTGIPIIYTVTIADTSHRKCVSLIHKNDSVVSTEHDKPFDKSALYVTYMFNIRNYVEDSLFSGGIQGSGKITLVYHGYVLYT